MPPLITREEARALGELEDHAEIEALIERAWQARVERFEDATDMCSLVNAQPPDFALTSEHMSVASSKRSTRASQARSISASISARSSSSPSARASLRVISGGIAPQSASRAGRQRHLRLPTAGAHDQLMLTPRAARNATIALAVTLTFSATTVVAQQRHDRQVDVSTSAPVAVNGSFVSPLVERFGRVQAGRDVFVAGNTTLRADPGRRVCLGAATNVQDNVFVLALSDRPAPRGTCAHRATQTGRRTSLAHQAEVINSRIGNFVFIGFHARLFNAVVQDGAFIGHGAVIRHVRIPRDRIVGIGQRVTTQTVANALPSKAEAHADFQREVLEVNEEFAEGYAELYHDEGHAAVTGVSRSPRTSFNRGLRPTIGSGLSREPFARIVGDVRLGADATVGRRTSIRADEGAPIAIGAGAQIEDRVTFHALSGTSITIGDRLATDDNVVFHGPLQVGHDLTIGDDAILFRATVGNGVTIGDSAIIAGPADDPIQLPDGTSVPAHAVITTQAQADALG